MNVILTIWHNNTGRPLPLAGGFECKGQNGDLIMDEGRSGISPFSPESGDTVREFVKTIERYGAAIVTDNRTWRPTNHRVIGVGAGHDDADWAESRFLDGSHAAWKENGKGERIDAATYSDGRPMYPREIEGLRFLDKARAWKQHFVDFGPFVNT